MKRSVVEIGKRFGRLVILEDCGSKNQKTIVKCLCDCGVIVIRTLYSLKRNKIPSCGCFSRDRFTTHGLSNTKEHKIWLSMKERCRNNPLYKNINVCQRWLNSFKNFYEDMGSRPADKHSIDRIDNNGDYCPENCRWATSKQQANNRRDNIFFTYNNEKLTIAELSSKYKITYEILRDRLIERKWDINKAIEVPVKLGNNKYNT